MSEPLRFRAIVLSVVKHDYIPLAVAAHRRFELVAVADQPDRPEWTHERNQQLADQFSIPYCRDIRAAIDRHRPQVAVISSEAERHCELAVMAAEAGLHIVVDKPMSTQLSECDRLVEAAKKAGVQTLVWNRNLFPAIRHAHDLVQSGEIGKLRAIHCDFYFSKDAGPPKSSGAKGAPPINWLERQLEAHADGSDGAVGTQAMGELEVEGIYPLAYFRMLSGATVRRVFARTASHFHQAHVDNQVDDLATVTLEMDSGLVGSLCLGRIGADSHPDLGEIKLHLLGTEGSLVISESRPEVAVYYRGQPRSEFPHRRIAEENDYWLMEDFVQAIESGSSTILNAEAGREICAIIAACLQSARRGEVIEVGVQR